MHNTSLRFFYTSLSAQQLFLLKKKNNVSIISGMSDIKNNQYVGRNSAMTRHCCASVDIDLYNVNGSTRLLLMILT